MTRFENCAVCAARSGAAIATTDLVLLCGPHEREFRASLEYARFDHYATAGKWSAARVALADWLRRMDGERRARGMRS